MKTNSNRPLPISDFTSTCRDWLILAAHYLLLCGAQAAYARAYVNSPALRDGIVLPILWRLIIWTFPVFLLLFLSRINPFHYLMLLRNARRGLSWGILIGAAIVVVTIVGTGATTGRLSLNLNLGANRWIGPILLVGLSEEVLFRGFFLQKFSELTTFARANLIQAVLFLLVHFPGWMMLGAFRGPAIVQNIACVFGLGLFLGFVLRKTHSLWACMVIHSLNNFASLVIT
jgi:uncharacterized protein